MLAHKTIDVFALHMPDIEGKTYINIPPRLQGKLFLRNPSDYVGEVWGDSRVRFWIRKSYVVGDSVLLKGMVIGGSSYPIGAHFSIPIQFLDGKGVYRHLLTWHTGR
jgi:hypothetical protein